MKMEFSATLRYSAPKDSSTYKFDFNAHPPTSALPAMTASTAAADFCHFERYASLPVNAVVAAQAAPLVPMPVMTESMPVGFQEALSGPILGAVGPVSGEGWVLIPPMRTTAPPRLRERPTGCKTIFVGGLPKALVEDQERADTILKAIFIRFDGIREVRVNQRQFAHVRFYSEEATEAAVRFSGFRLVLDGIDDKEHTGRMHVDYACNREDMREWEAHIRALERERRLQERLNPSSPTPITPFSDTEVSVLTEKIKDTETFDRASQVLFTWLDRGELHRRNANSFYSLIQCANSHIRQLVTQKKTSEEELEIARANYERRMTVIIEQLGQIQNILQAASKQKCWDHFSKPQRKNLETWRKQCETLLLQEQNQHLEQRQEDEMDLSDSDMDTADNAQPSDLAPTAPSAIMMTPESHVTQPAVERADYNDPALLVENARLKDQVTALQRQLVRVITGSQEGSAAGSKRPRSGSTGEEAAAAAVGRSCEVDAETASLKQALQGTQQSLLAMQKELQQERALRKQLLVQVAAGGESQKQELSPSELRAIGFISSFLAVHPFGASLSAILSFLSSAGFGLTEADVTGLLCRSSSLFGLSNSVLGPRWALVRSFEVAAECEGSVDMEESAESDKSAEFEENAEITVIAETEKDAEFKGSESAEKAESVKDLRPVNVATPETDAATMNTATSETDAASMNIATTETDAATMNTATSETDAASMNIATSETDATTMNFATTETDTASMNIATSETDATPTDSAGRDESAMNAGAPVTNCPPGAPANS